MKKQISFIAVLLLLSLSACSAQTTAANHIVMLDAGAWPDNSYTKGLPVPRGTVTHAMLDTEHKNCSIDVDPADESAYRDYMERLEQEGFRVIEAVSETIKGQDSVSDGTLLSDGDRWLSINSIPDHFTIYISHWKNKKGTHRSRSGAMRPFSLFFTFFGTD